MWTLKTTEDDVMLTHVGFAVGVRCRRRPLKMELTNCKHSGQMAVVNCSLSRKVMHGCGSEFAVLYGARRQARPCVECISVSLIDTQAM